MERCNKPQMLDLFSSILLECENVVSVGCRLCMPFAGGVLVFFPGAHLYTVWHATYNEFDFAK